MMGYVKEPKGIDFIIQSDPLTAVERATISAFIRNYKAEQGKKQPTHNNMTAVKSRGKTANDHADQK